MTGAAESSGVTGRSGALGAATGAFGLPLAGLRLLLRERSLWSVAALPFALSLLTCAAVAAGLVVWGGELRAFATAWMPALAAERWFEWLWIGPARLLLAGLGWLLVAALAAVGLVGAFLLANLAAAPFHEVLSRRVEKVVTGCVLEASPQSVGASLANAARSVFEELRRLVFFLGLQGLIVLAGLVVPGGALLAPPAMALLTVLFLPLDYASHVLDRRGVLRFRDKRRWLLEHRAATLGFGAAGFGICLVPGLNFLAMPALVAGGTLLALRHPPRAPDEDAGSARAP